ncbi:MAG: hypothetical protein JNN03_05395 [Rubrivivax sp.]|nr:hypothetical protein [Rubrivivax sp.]
MTPPPTRSALHIATAAAREQPASPEHRRFKTLLTKIEAARERLAAWHAQAPVFARTHAQRVQPEHERLRAARRAWALELERIALGDWAKPDRETLSRMVCELCGALLEAGEPDAAPDEEIKAVYNRFSEVDYDTEARLQVQAMRARLEAMGDIDLGSEPVHSVDELMERVQAELARRREAGMDDAGIGAAGSGPHHRRAAPKTKTAAQRRAEEDARRISQTVRQVYRKLAAALHPDRIDTEASAAERSERTALMQRANSAYEAGDLLALLTLQLQIEQVDVAHAASVAASQVKHFNKVLAEQLREIEAEIDERQLALCSSYGLVVQRRLKPEQLGALLKDELREIAAAAAELASEQRALRGAPEAARRWLKHKRAEMRFEEQMGEFMNEHFAKRAGQAAQAVQAAGPSPKRKRR